MMTMKNIGEMLMLLESNYGQKFYDGVDKDNVLKTWSVTFKDDDPSQVMQAVINTINTMPYKPTIADIRKRMAQAKMGGQMTELEAFQKINTAVEKAYGENDALKQFQALPPILQKLVGTPTQLRDWRTVETAQFQTVIASMIRSSYRELAQREADYYALPTQVQKNEAWRIAAPDTTALPEPKQPESIQDMLTRIEAEAKAYRERYGMTANPEYSDRVADFKKPVTKEDIQRVERAENRKSDWSLKK